MNFAPIQAQGFNQKSFKQPMPAQHIHGQSFPSRGETDAFRADNNEAIRFPPSF